MSTYDYHWTDEISLSDIYDRGPAEPKARYCYECGQLGTHHPNCPAHPGEPDVEDDQ